MVELVNEQTQDRRRYHRYNASSISVSISTCGDSPEHASISIIDFNRYGLALYSDHNHKVGETLDLTLADQSGHTVEVVGFVCNRAPTSDGFRCGLRFVETNTSNKSQLATLFQMEEMLESIAS